MFLEDVGLNHYKQKNPVESRLATNQRICKFLKNGYYVLLHDSMTLNQERKTCPHLRESGEIHPGVHGIVRRKKACTSQHFLRKNPNQPQTTTKILPVTILPNSVSYGRTSVFKSEMPVKNLLSWTCILTTALNCTCTTERLYLYWQGIQHKQTWRAKHLVLRIWHPHCTCFSSFYVRLTVIWYHWMNTH